MKLYGFEFSTNVERVQLALAHKGLKVEFIPVDPKDRSEVRRVSGQDLVPVIVDDGKVVADSMEIVRYLEQKHPSRPLYPEAPERLAEMLIFIDWFNRVWKRPPNEIEAEMGKPTPDRARIERLGRAMIDALDLFEKMLTGREHLMGEFSAADCCAFPFLKYGVLGTEPNDAYLFHRVLVDWQPIKKDHPRLGEWIRRVDKRPRQA
ncbi:MAG TPA: glutathione S-transferase family protein [Patescibacteria group bacterium]|nr:glutathione S-transferase family protein [Patescibacteria group bacterium]